MSIPYKRATDVAYFFDSYFFLIYCLNTEEAGVASYSTADFAFHISGLSIREKRGKKASLPSEPAFTAPCRVVIVIQLRELLLFGCVVDFD